MECYNINLQKRNKALRVYVRRHIRETKFFYICYCLTIFFRIMAVILAIVNIGYVIVESDVLALILLIITFGFPMLLSFLPATVYIIGVGGEYRLRRQEMIVFREDEFIYSHKDDRSGLADCQYCCKVKYSEIKDIIVDEKTKIIEIHGNIIAETYESSVLKETLNAKIFDFIDAYDVDVVEMIKKSMKLEVH